MITIVGYGLGNCMAIANIYKRLNIDTCIATTREELQGAEKIILPGVGAFDWAMTSLNRSNMRETLDELVIGKSKAVLGICVGMQMMARRSEEGVLEGLGWIDAEVKRFNEASFTQKTHLPHMGWSDVRPIGVAPLFKGLHHGARFYFLHSYYVVPGIEECVLSTTDYSGSFASGVQSGNVYGVQFHPEKSHQWGVQLLKNFAEI